ncbi:uncharacterized protein M6B38_102015 [Iris pallida]|uniref:Nodulin-like domain-containing protein n=1 Tax=Iris pallida TaxID=29817 RepID=A0AAX6IRB6_IRIPA|nr:uncharacterized protein M6B38_102015 [Iris pallida]
MAGQSRKWMILVATIWIQAFTGTNFDFSAYSSQLKSVMGISQVQLNYLATASDLGKVFGWSSGLALLYLPLPLVLFLAAAVGFLSYGLQWLLITSTISLPYLPVFFLCLLAGCSICWFNTVCFVLCIQNFPVNRSLALALTISFNGVSAAIYSLAANALSGSGGRGSPSSYLLLNAVLPLLASSAALLPILRPPPSSTTALPPDGARRDSHAFLLLNVIAFCTGLYLLLLNPSPSAASSEDDGLLAARVLFAGAIALLVLPLCIPGLVFAREWARRSIYSSFRFDEPVNLVDSGELYKSLISGGESSVWEDEKDLQVPTLSSWWCCCCREKAGIVGAWKDELSVLGEEHGPRKLVARIDFWLYYAAYFCGATVGLVYSNNLGQIAQSLGRQSQTTTLLTVYSSCSFFGRLVSAVPDFLRGKLHFARTGWLMIALVPTPLAFFLLAESSDERALIAGTGLVGLSSGFIFAAAVSVTAELFGPNSVGLNHNILITNIPLGSLLYGLLAALVYDANGTSGSAAASALSGVKTVCMGKECYGPTFLSWGVISLVGLVCSVALYLRTRKAYSHAAQSPLMALIHGESFTSESFSGQSGLL